MRLFLLAGGLAGGACTEHMPWPGEGFEGARSEDLLGGSWKIENGFGSPGEQLAIAHAQRNEIGIHEHAGNRENSLEEHDSG